ncbi:hypothetical protein GH733_000301 [Mirounga leonina]|nr:hypothetical protein GH733_000301 [Mirounga leonina]
MGEDTGHRKSKWKLPSKKMTVILETQHLPSCNHEKFCEEKMDCACNSRVISCTVCLEKSQTLVTCLSEPVDLYSHWTHTCVYGVGSSSTPPALWPLELDSLPSFNAFQGVWPEIKSHSPTGPLAGPQQNSPFSY